jgi:two-component system chemotaxis response regulator CheB
MRRILVDALTSQGFDVVAEARDGDEAVELCRRHQPDALTLDLAMPGLDGVGVLKALTDTRGRTLPIVVVSALSPAHSMKAMEALSEGAFDFVVKPASPAAREPFVTELAEKVDLAAASARGARWSRVGEGARTSRGAAATRPVTKRFVVIASSTGGPRALGRLIPRLPAPLGFGGVIVQHMPAGFTKSLAMRLDGASKLSVREASTRDAIDPATLLLAQGGNHLRLGDAGRTFFSREPQANGLCPVADLTIADAARLHGSRVLLVVLTGMGRDGLQGARAVKARGGVVLVEAEETCTVYGMPRAVEEAGLADEVLPLDRLPEAIAREAGA